MSKMQNSKIINSNGWVPELPDKEIWQQAMENLIVTNQPKDVRITIGKDVFECYSCVLRTFCELFADTMLPGKSLILPAYKITADAFAIAYNWMVSWDSQCLRGKLLDLFLAAEYLCATKLLNSIYDALNNDAYFSNLDAVTCYIDASYKGIKDVADLMIERFGKSFLVILPSNEFHQMDVDSLCYLLSSDLLGVHTEVEVFYAAVMWLLSNYTERKVHLRRVMNTVRFELMPSLVLLNFGERLHEIMPGAVDLKLFLVQLAIINSHTVSNKELKELAQHHRIYIKDPLCPYLHLLEQRTEELHAMLFKDYIVSLQYKFEEFKARIIEEEVEENGEDDTDEYMMGEEQDDEDVDTEEETNQNYMNE